MSKQRKPVPSRSTGAATAPALAALPDFFRNTLLQSGLIFAFSFLLYANTLTHGFVLDDAIVITDNMYTSKGVEGIPGILSKETFFGFFKVEGKETLVSGGRYRPMTLVLFAMVYQVAGASPFIFHLLTILLFAATCVVLYRTLLLLLGPRGGDYAALFSWLAALLFAAHPIHTEVVDNIKGCDEIVTLLGSLATLYFTVKAYDTGKRKWNILAAVIFFLACLSKENAVTFVAVIPLALWVFRSASASAIVKNMTPVFVSFLAFFFIRGAILHWKFGGAPMELMNNPYLKIQGTQWVPFTGAEKLATIFYTLWKYVQLLFVPYSLTHDYYPRVIDIMTFGNAAVLFSVVLYFGMAWYAVSGIAKRDPLRFGILYYLLTLSIVSNFVFPVGTNMGERFAFMPSVGFCMVLASLLYYFRSKMNNLNVLLGVFGVIMLLFSVKTITRNPAWESNEKLFFTDVKVSKNSAKIQNACGGVLFDKASKEKNEVRRNELCNQALSHLNRAIQLYPNYSDAYVSRGGAHYYLKLYDESIADYRRAVELSSSDPRWKTYLALALRDGGRYQGEQRGNIPLAYQYLQESWQFNPKDAETARLIGVSHGMQGDNAGAIEWFTKAVQLAPDVPIYMFDLGQAYSASGDLAKGEQLRQQAIAKDPMLMKDRQRK
ncbi:MAG TPA: tetratricopeptide repeat protein [Saprospiraceae bacterium]|nr:tetratricopeptide repeat protein [Saprospiraceae bacterium]HPI07878.1 tetratricopeptide repeat protein [Saprospiraceae bacterium]